VAKIRTNEGLLLAEISGTAEGALIDGTSAQMDAFEAAMITASDMDAAIARLVDALRMDREASASALSEVTGALLANVNFAAAQKADEAGNIIVEASALFDTYLIGEDALSAEVAGGMLSQASDILAGLSEGNTTDEFRAQVSGLTDIVSAMLREQQDIIAAVTEKQAQFALLDRIGPETLDRIEEAAVLIDDQNRAASRTVASETDAAQRNALVFIIAGGLLGAVVAFVIARQISQSLIRMTSVMGEVAEGNLDIDIQPTEATHELARMNNAMVIFLDNARKARDLTAQMADAEELEKERAKAEKDREARAQAEAAAAEEREATARAERERVKALEAFQKDMEHIISQAAAGNFANRMVADGTDENLIALAQAVNVLLESVEGNIDQLLRSTAALADGRLDAKLTGDAQGAFLRLQTDFNGAVEKLSHSMGLITQNGFSVSNGASELEQAARGMATRAEQNAASVSETSTAVEELTASVKRMVENARGVDASTKRARESALHSREVSQETEKSISALSDASARINRVVQVIEDIAFQINLLALNAGVEAARAGGAGRGFAVVASEVRSLAQRSQEAVHEISEVIVENNRIVEESVRQMDMSRTATETIVEEIGRASTQISEIARATEEQAQVLEDINSSVQDLGSTAQTNAAASEEITAASVMLNQESDSLSETLRGFKGVAQVAQPTEPQRRVA
ncbi:MAG: methyl-accepting chemotaxis protein, partial [Pseudomonadota bacterium]